MIEKIFTKEEANALLMFHDTVIELPFIVRCYYCFIMALFPKILRREFKDNLNKCVKE